MKRSISPFGNESVRLRLIEEKDLQATLSWRNREEARVWFKSSGLLSYEQHRGWFQRYQEKDDDFLFVVEADGNLVGQASVYGVDWNTASAEVGRFLVAPEGAGKGYIHRACGELVRFCGEVLNLQYVFLEVFEHNERAFRLYQQNGFVEEQRYDGLIRMGRRTAGIE
ncbi:GNAT family N-acetyltransferase [Metapseudomonas lalkuanensis]|uniref:GNAT family N-acetyltransferase n=1 Tax=Metapseudomonas lalkuanensis TaxID=2604832 RepID=UPI001CF0DDAE|nr:GNAT family N-acetyltransferase [Pseudomonas lalkuanensis]UCO97919.1 GNAT family N-acetyltransferase [Pseudomonas lalkuanensis]